MTKPVSELDKLVTEFCPRLSNRCATAPVIDRQEPWQQIALSAVALLSCVVTGAALAESAGRVQHLSGSLFVQRADGTVGVLAQQSEVNAGDRLTTLTNSYAQINFIDGSSMTLRPNTQISIEAFHFLHEKPEADNAFFRLIKGGIRTVTGLVGKRGDMDAYKIGTTVVVVGIRGSSGDTLDCVAGCEGVSSTSDRLERGVYHATYTGSYVLHNENGSEIVNEGQVGFVKSTKSSPQILPRDPGLNLLNAPFMVALASDRAYRGGSDDGKQRAANSYSQTIGQGLGTDRGQRVGQGGDSGGNQSTTGQGDGNGNGNGQSSASDRAYRGGSEDGRQRATYGYGQQGFRTDGGQGVGQGNGNGQSMGQGNGIGGQSMGQGNGVGGQGMGQGNGIGVGQNMGRSFGNGTGGWMGGNNGYGGGRR